MVTPAPKLYGELAEWYPLLTPVKHYKEEAEDFHKIFTEHADSRIETMLELGSGTGHNAYYLKQWYALTLSDLSEEMLAISRKLNPECEHVQGDMRTLRLDREFDAVFIHDAIMYMTSEQDLERALKTAYIHLKPGGIALIAPDFTKETFKPATRHGGSDGKDRAMRYLEWIWDPDPEDALANADFMYAFRDTEGEIATEHDRHIFGLFPTEIWLRTCEAAGFQVKVVKDTFRAIDFLCRKSS